MIIGGLILFIILVALYFVPSIVAVSTAHPHVAGIVILNVFLGWTLAGWVGALVWSLVKPTPQQIVFTRIDVPGTPQPGFYQAPIVADIRACPHCAETIKQAARMCRFCGRDVDPAAAR